MPYSKGEHPFASKKQMKYLWANEPEIAREKTDAAKASGVSMIGPRHAKKSFLKKTRNKSNA
jgi:hypothetical protein